MIEKIVEVDGQIVLIEHFSGSAIGLHSKPIKPVKLSEGVYITPFPNIPVAVSKDSDIVLTIRGIGGE